MFTALASHKTYKFYILRISLPKDFTAWELLQFHIYIACLRRLNKTLYMQWCFDYTDGHDSLYGALIIGR